MPLAPSPARSFWLTLLIAALALAAVILAGAALGHVFGLDGSAPSVGKSPFGVGISEGGGSVGLDFVRSIAIFPHDDGSA